MQVSRFQIPRGPRAEFEVSGCAANRAQRELAAGIWKSGILRPLRPRVRFPDPQVPAALACASPPKKRNEIGRTPRLPQGVRPMIIVTPSTSRPITKSGRYTVENDPERTIGFARVARSKSAGHFGSHDRAWYPRAIDDRRRTQIRSHDQIERRRRNRQPIRPCRALSGADIYG
jgi:hypothetical protein